MTGDPYFKVTVNNREGQSHTYPLDFLDIDILYASNMLIYYAYSSKSGCSAILSPPQGGMLVMFIYITTDACSAFEQ